MSHETNLKILALELAETLQETIARLDVLSVDDKDDVLIERCNELLDRYWGVTK